MARGILPPWPCQYCRPALDSEQAGLRDCRWLLTAPGCPSLPHKHCQQAGHRSNWMAAYDLNRQLDACLKLLGTACRQIGRQGRVLTDGGNTQITCG